jgi:hypothetical protein
MFVIDGYSSGSIWSNTSIPKDRMSVIGVVTDDRVSTLM